MNLDFWRGHFLGFITAIGCLWLMELNGKKNRHTEVILITIYATVILVMTFVRAGQ